MATYILLSPKNLKLMSVSWQTKSPANKRRYRKPSTFSHLQMKKKMSKNCQMLFDRGNEGKKTLFRGVCLLARFLAFRCFGCVCCV